MKKIKGTLLLLSLAACYGQAHAQTTYQTRVIDVRNFKEPAVNWKNPNDVATYYAELAHHKDREVTVYQKDVFYQVNYYQKENDSIKMHGFNISETGPFTKADYKWSNDTLCIHLLSANGQSKEYKGYGRGNTNAMKID